MSGNTQAAPQKYPGFSPEIPRPLLRNTQAAPQTPMVRPMATSQWPWGGPGSGCQVKVPRKFFVAQGASPFASSYFFYQAPSFFSTPCPPPRKTRTRTRTHNATRAPQTHMQTRGPEDLGFSSSFAFPTENNPHAPVSACIDVHGWCCGRAGHPPPIQIKRTTRPRGISSSLLVRFAARCGAAGARRWRGTIAALSQCASAKPIATSRPPRVAVA